MQELDAIVDNADVPRAPPRMRVKAVVRKTLGKQLQTKYIPSTIVPAALLLSRLAALPAGSILEFFCGTAGFTSQVNKRFLGRALGFDNTVIEKQNSDEVLFVDLIDCFTLETLLKFLNKPGQVKGIGGGVPCGTCSMARRGRKGGFPRRLRPLSLPWGLADDDFTERERKTLRLANACILAFIEICKVCLQLAVPFWFENPLRSYLWHMREIIALKCIWVPFSQCMFAGDIRKDTRICFGNVRLDSLIAFTSRGLCKSKKKLCCRTGCLHRQISPSTVSKNMFKHWFDTQESAHYPTELSAALARVMTL